MKFPLSTARRLGAAAITAAALVGAVSCTPDAGTDGTTTTTTEVPTAKAVLSPASGPAGSFVDVTAPGDQCAAVDGVYPYTQLQAAITIPATGVVIAQNFQFLGSPFSQYAGNDDFVHLRIPPATAPGVYNVYLSCYSYLDTYAFAPAKFTVTAPGA